MNPVFSSHFQTRQVWKKIGDPNNCKVIEVGGRRLPSCWNLCCGIKTALNHPLSTFSLGNFLAGNKKVLSLLLAKRYFVGEEERSSGAHLIIHFGISSLPLALPSQGYFSDWYGRQLTISNLAWFPIKSVKPFSELQEILQSIPYKMIT